MWQPVCSWPWLVLAVLLVIAVVAWSFIRGVRSRRRIVVLGILRALMLVVLLLLLLQPQRRTDEVTTLRPQLAVLVDGSESMTDPVDDKQPRRAQRVIEWLGSKSVEQAKNDFDLRVFRFDSTLTEPPPNVREWSFNGATSHVLEAVNQVRERFRGQPLAAVLLLSDGIDTTGAPDAKTVSGGVPVFSFELEKPFARKQHPKRISLAGVDYPPRAAIGWNTEIRVSLAGSGMGGQTVSVELWQDGHKVAEKPAAFNEDGQTRSVAFAVSHDKPGTVKYETRVSDPAADKEARSHPFLIEVMEPGNRVLYVQNALGFDFKFLRKAIVGDRNLKLSAFVRWADGRLAQLDDNGGQADGAADFSPKALANCAVVILGDLAPEALSAENAAALRNFVDRGGGLVLLGGPNLFASANLGPLAAALPVGLPAPYREGKFPVRITETGLHHPVFGPLFAQVKDFPPLLTCNVASTVAPTAEVLMQADVGGALHPVIVGMRFGQGRVVAVLTDTLWRWRLAAGGWSSDRSPYDTFWIQLMDWLIPKEQDKQTGSRIELFTERTNYSLGERPEVRAIVRTPVSGVPLPPTLPLRIRTPDDKAFDYVLKAATLQTPGGKPVSGYRAEVEPNMPGVFVAQSSVTLDGAEATNETRFVVNRPPTEITGKPINRDLLQRIAEATGGRFYKIEDWDAWPRDLHFKQQQFSRVRLEDLWNNPALLGFLLLLVTAEWIVRKSWNLP